MTNNLHQKCITDESDELQLRFIAILLLRLVISDLLIRLIDSDFQIWLIIILLLRLVIGDLRLSLIDSDLQIRLIVSELRLIHINDQVGFNT